MASLALLPQPRRRLLIDAAPLGEGVDPYKVAERGIDELAWLYADGLVGWSGGLVPALARRLPQASDDGLTYRYELRRVKWHDGRLLNARDVSEAFDIVAASTWGGYEPYRSVLKVVVRDEDNFEVKLRVPRQGFVRSFFGPYGVPALPLIRHANDGTPIGTGPFAIVGRPELGRWTLRRATTSPRGTPRIDEIALRLILKETTANVQIMSGEADIALPLPPDPSPGGYRVVSRLTSIEVLLLNARGVFDSIEARRALVASIDVARLQRIFRRAPGPLEAKLTLSGASDAAYARLLSTRLERSAELRRIVNGRAVRLLYVAQSPANQRVMLELAQDLRLLGIATRLVPVPGERYFDFNRPLRRGDFDVAAYGVAYGDGADLAADWASDAVPPHGGNFSRWHDHDTDAALARDDSGAALRRLYDGIACVVIGAARERIGIASQVRGFEDPPLLVPATYGCAKWSF
jgi:ABC-type transport system substrate-binding protein